MTAPRDAESRLLHWLDSERDRQLDFLRAFTRIDTCNPPGDTTQAADLFRQFLDAEGIAHRIEAPQPSTPNLIASFAGGQLRAAVQFAPRDHHLVHLVGAVGEAEHAAEAPHRRQRRVEEDWEDLLESLADAGEVTRASLPKLDWTWRVKGLGLPAGTAERTLGEIRAERDGPDA